MIKISFGMVLAVCPDCGWDMVAAIAPGHSPKARWLHHSMTRTKIHLQADCPRVTP